MSVHSQSKVDEINSETITKVLKQLTSAIPQQKLCVSSVDALHLKTLVL